MSEQELKKLLEQAANLPEPTRREREEQAFSFAYGNLAMSTNHKPVRKYFKDLALSRGWTENEFEGWADTKTWWD